MTSQYLVRIRTRDQTEPDVIDAAEVRGALESICDEAHVEELVVTKLSARMVGGEVQLDEVGTPIGFEDDR